VNVATVSFFVAQLTITVPSVNLLQKKPSTKIIVLILLTEVREIIAMTTVAEKYFEAPTSKVGALNILIQTPL